MRIAGITTLSILLAAGSAAAQDEAARVERKVAGEITRVPLEIPVTGAPYSAETIVEALQVLADGNRIVRRTTGRVYRDGEGRTRREEDGQVPTGKNWATGMVSFTSRSSISIIDPVAGFSYSLDQDRKIAWRTPFGAGAAIMNQLDEMKLAMMKKEMEQRQQTGGDPNKAAAEEKAKAAQEKAARAAAEAGARGGAPWVGVALMGARGGGTNEAVRAPQTPLEHKVLEGIPVEGRKTTTTLAPGQVGNEQPLTIASEEWRSPELNVLVMTHHSDPRSGESTYRLTNIVRAEPDRSLFMVPSDYEIRDTGVRKMLEAKK
jgi:hypothetical protein